MTISGRMEDQSHMTKRILDLTLEIIYLLTGEDYEVVKKKSNQKLTPRSRPHEDSPPPFLTPERDKKIRKVTQKMMEVLTEEVPIRCQDVSVYLSMEEWEYLEEHKDLYKDLIMEDHQPLPSPDGSRDCPHRCPRPLDSAQETPPHPQENQGENFITIKVEVKEEEEEILVGGAQQSMGEELGMMMTMEEGESFRHIGSDGRIMEEPLEKHFPSLSGWTSELNGFRSSSPANPHHTPYHVTPPDPSYLGMSCDQSLTSDTRWRFLGVGGSTEIHGSESSLSCLGCRKCFQTKSELLLHLRSHTSVTFSCSECGKCFDNKSELDTHRRTHIKENQHLCLECGRCFAERRALVIHQRSHTGERPFSCPQCGKGFTQKGSLLTHQRSHTGECPFPCSVCGKSFTVKGKLQAHERSHTGERPFPCAECGKRFTQKGSLLYHQRIHTGERPYVCSLCGKCFTHKGNLVRHQNTH